MGYGHILIYVVVCDTIVLEFISSLICITCCVVSVLICAITASAGVPHLAVTAKYVVHKLSFASRFTYLTQYATPHRIPSQ